MNFVIEIRHYAKPQNVIGKFRMSATNDIRDIFLILHDGTISAWTGEKNLLTLTVDCEYLAELIDKSFDKFFLWFSASTFVVKIATFAIPETVKQPCGVPQTPQQ
jgi:hypothetical protein